MVVWIYGNKAKWLHLSNFVPFVFLFWSYSYINFAQECVAFGGFLPNGTKSKANKKLQIKGFCTKDTKQLIKASIQRGQLAFNKIWLHKHSSFSILLRRVKAVTKQNYVITTAMIQTWVQWQCYSDNVTLKCDSVRKMCYILFPFPLQFPLNYKSEKYDFYFFPL